jgi:hypothetical protein
MSNDCYGHAFIFTVKITGIPPHCIHRMRVMLERNVPVVIVSVVHERKERESPTPRLEWDWIGPMKAFTLGLKDKKVGYNGVITEICKPKRLFVLENRNKSHNQTSKSI